jgi:Cu(I)/Ag(I) efflux system membrane fusion protein
VEGWIEKLYVKTVGDPVKSGEPLYELYSPTLVNAQEELVLALKRNNPKLIQAAIERLTALQIPKTEIDRVRKTGWVSQTIIVNAPQSGVVDNLMVREGMFVKPGISLMSIGQLEHIWVIGELFESQAMRVQEGDGVRMHLDYLPGREWLGTVDYIYPTLDTTTRTAQVRVHFDNPDGFLKPGMFAQMRIDATPVDNTLLIPKEALIRTGSQSRVVLAFGDGSFKSIAVKVGQVSDEQAEITSGLNEGDRIVASAQFLIDSESSKTSDFRRMNHGFDDDEKVKTPTSVWVGARIESLMTEHRMLTLAHEPIDAWQWPAMVMDFSADTSIELEGLKPGMNLHVEITRNGDGNYVISQIHRPDSTSGERLMKQHDQSMDHGQHQPKGQNGMAMDHSNHKTKNHDAMNRDLSQHGEEGNP